MPNPWWNVSAMAMPFAQRPSIRLWNLEDYERGDQKEDRCWSVLAHGAPVQQVLFLASSASSSTVGVPPVWLLSAGGTTVKIWNPVTGTAVCVCPVQHAKSLTSVLAVPRAVAPSTSNAEVPNKVLRIWTAGLDGLIRVHAWEPTTGQMNHVHGLKLQQQQPPTDKSKSSSSPGITSLALTPQGDRVAIGWTDGTVWVRQQGPQKMPQKRLRDPKAGTYAFFTRGMNASAGQGDIIVGGGTTNSTGAADDYGGGILTSPATKKRKLRKFDMALKQFRYADALDEALETRIPSVVVAVFEELGKRRGLTIALHNRDEESLEPVLSFVARYIARPRFTALLVGVTNKLVDIYQDVAGQSETIDELFGKLKNQVKGEAVAQKKLLGVVGQLDMLLTASELQEPLEDED